MKKIILLAAIFPFFCFSQKLKCEDFKIGNFIITTEEFPGVEISIYRDETSQIEIKTTDNENQFEGVPEKIYEKIEWLSECRYKLTFDNSKGKPSEVSEFINTNGGIITDIISFEGNCYIYEASLMVDGKPQKIKGKVCKDMSN